MEIIIKLSETQVKALKTLDLSDVAQDIAEKAVATAIRGKYKYHADKAEGETAKSYDWALRSGAKFDKDKGTFITTYMREIRDTLNNL
jgi:hypothetical protein